MNNEEIHKLDMKSKDIVEDNISKISELFPDCINEGKIDFDMLKQELSKDIIEDGKERYQLTWVGKKEAIVNANTPCNKTLRPVKEKSVDFDKTKNIYIEGDNLEVLKILQESYLNKVSIIYIDPPYNTGNDLIYNDRFTNSEEDELLETGQIDEVGNKMITNSNSNGRYHSDWLSMIYPRLKLARNLLKKDGLIFISIDDNELANLKNLCDEIFGENNFIANIVVESGGAYGAKVAHKDKTIFKVKDYVLVYSKDSSIDKIRIPLYDKANDLFDSRYNFFIKDNIKRSLIDYFRDDKKISECFRKYNLSVDKSNIAKLMQISDDFNKMILNELSQYIYKDSQFTLKLPDNILKKCDEDEIVYYDKYMLMKTQNGKIRHLQSFKETLRLSDDCDASVQRCVLRGDLWKDFSKDMGNVGKEGGVSFLNGKKPIRLIKNLIKWANEPDGIILDFFSGSATTAHAIMDLNREDNGKRKYILVQINQKINDEFDNICELGEERIRRSAKKIKEETNADIDYGFRVYKVDSSNMKDVYYTPTDLQQSQLNMFESNIKEDRTSEDLLTQVILDLGLTLDLSIEERKIINNNVYFVENNSLVACFDDTIDINIVDEICKCNPLKIVFKESSFKTDSDKINVFERIKKLSNDTEINII